MTRQTWQIVIGACLCFGLLPGCAHSVFSIFSRNKPVEPPKDKQVEAGNLGNATGKFPPEGGPLAGSGGPNSPYNPNNPNPQILRLPQPDGRIVPSVLPFDNPDVRIVEPIAGGDEQQEPPPFVRQRLKAAQPAPAPQAVAPPPEPLVVALAHLLKNDQEAATALNLLDRYDPATRDWFVRILPMLASLNKTPVANLPPEEVANMQEQLQWLLLALCARAPLVLDKMCYCEPEPDPERRGGYRYRRLPNEHAFLARSGALPGEWVCIYVELRNLGTVRNGSFYETRLSSSVEIKENGVRMHKRQFDARPLRSPDLSSDFYNTYSFYMPSGIPPGRYELTLEILDETTQPPRVVRKTLPFVVAAEALAGN
jgi:hypothetical protein